jgi:Xaa-Pro aminopeptidase
VIRELLEKAQIDWLNAYNASVLELLSPALDAEERLWLKEATKAI